MNSIIISKRFKKSLKKYRSPKDKKLIAQAIKKLEVIEPFENGALPRCHKLKGIKRDYWDYHIKPDLVMVFEFDTERKEIYLFEIGTHSNILD